MAVLSHLNMKHNNTHLQYQEKTASGTHEQIKRHHTFTIRGNMAFSLEFFLNREPGLFTKCASSSGKEAEDVAENGFVKDHTVYKPRALSENNPTFLGRGFTCSSAMLGSQSHFCSSSAF
jgi:hypothetical protein